MEVAVTDRRWLILLLFAAVFAMHGVQCTGAEATAAGSGQAMAMTDDPSATAVHGASSPVDDSGHVVTAASAAALLGAGETIAMDSAGSPGSPAALMGHLWSVCLAVLSAGLAVALLALTVVGVRAWLPPLLGAAGRRARARVRLPAPDLFALCVLRT